MKFKKLVLILFVSLCMKECFAVQNSIAALSLQDPIEQAGIEVAKADVAAAIGADALLALAKYAHVYERSKEDKVMNLLQQANAAADTLLASFGIIKPVDIDHKVEEKKMFL